MLWILFLFSLLIAYSVTKLTIVLSLHGGVLDVPSPRSLHSGLVPRMGGLGILCALYLSIAVLYLMRYWSVSEGPLSPRDLLVIIVMGVGIAATGLYDDLYRLKYATKFLMQLILAIVVVGAGIRLESFSVPFCRPVMLGGFSVPLTVLWLVGFSNVYNFMDGINGMAGGTGAIYGGLLILFAIRLGNPGLATVAILLTGGCLGFLFHNFPQARTFMGDVGSLFLGMLFALLVVRLAQGSHHPESLTAMLLVCSVFLYDGGFTILRRIRRRENIFQAHRSHLYQRLIQAGLSHAKVTGLYLLLHAAVGVLALAYLDVSEANRLWILGFVALLFFTLTLGVYRIEDSTIRS